MPAVLTEELFFPSRPSAWLDVLDVEEATGAPRLTAADAFGSESHTGLFCAGDPVNNTDPTGLDTFYGNRRIGTSGEAIHWNSWAPRHMFVYTTNGNGSLANTYSWGNNGAYGTWTHSTPQYSGPNSGPDRVAATTLIANNWGSRQGGAAFDSYVQQAYDQIKDRPAHLNLGVANNCFAAARTLVSIARSLQNLAGGNNSNFFAFLSLAINNGGPIPGTNFTYGGYSATIPSSGNWIYGGNDAPPGSIVGNIGGENIYQGALFEGFGPYGSTTTHAAAWEATWGNGSAYGVPPPNNSLDRQQRTKRREGG